MTTDIKLLPLPEADGFMETFDTYGCPVGSEDAWGEKTVRETIRANVAHATAAKDAEIEALRAALESLKAHKENAAMNQIGVIKALTEARDELGAEIHRLRAELKIEKGQAEFYRTTRNWSQQKAERLAEALREKADKWDRIGDEHGVRQFTGNDHKLFANELRALLRDHDQEGKDG